MNKTDYEIPLPGGAAILVNVSTEQEPPQAPKAGLTVAAPPAKTTYTLKISFRPVIDLTIDGGQQIQTQILETTDQGTFAAYLKPINALIFLCQHTDAGAITVPSASPSPP